MALSVEDLFRAASQKNQIWVRAGEAEGRAVFFGFGGLLGSKTIEGLLGPLALLEAYWRFAGVDLVSHWRAIGSNRGPIGGLLQAFGGLCGPIGGLLGPMEAYSGLYWRQSWSLLIPTRCFLGYP